MSCEMDLHHFFENMVRREETASAFLATMLEYDSDFRREFLREAIGDPTLVDHEEWDVRVEDGHVDVTLDSPTQRVLIEDKIRAGARQRGQLLRYYQAAVNTVPAKRIVAVYLAPGGQGLGEVDAVEQSSSRGDRPMDVVAQLPWKTVGKIIAELPNERDRWFARSGIEQVLKAVELARQEKYPAVGDRAVIRAIADVAYRDLQRTAGVNLRRWSARDTEQIYTVGTPVTMWLGIVFETAPEAPFSPVGVVQGEHIHLELDTRIKLAGKVKSTTKLARRWDHLLSAGEIEIPAVGRHDLSPGKWLVRTVPIAGTRDAIAAAMSQAGQFVLDFLRPYLSLPDDLADT